MLSGFEGPFYASIVEANVAASEKFIGMPWTYTANGCAMPRLGDSITLSVEGGVDLVARVDELGDGTASGVITAVRATPPPVVWDEDDE